MPDILIIEDDPEMGPLIKDLMINEGFSARLCASAEEALELFEYTPFSIVLLDVMLPHMDGFETCTAIRQKQDIPILMMSAMTDEDSKLLGYKTGADDYIDKPFSVKVLAAKVRALMKRAPAAEKEPLVSSSIIEITRQIKLNIHNRPTTQSATILPAFMYPTASVARILTPSITDIPP